METQTHKHSLRTYTLHEAAEIFSISVPTLRRLIKSGEILSSRIGAQHRITDTELRRALHLEQESK